MSSFSEAQYSSTSIFETSKQDKPRPNWWKSKNSICLVLLSIVEAVIVISLESVIFIRFEQTEISHTEELASGIPVYLMIFIFSQIFQIFFTTDAVRNQNTIQVIGFLLFNTCCFIYALFQFKQMRNVFYNNFSTRVSNLTDQAILDLIDRLLIGVAVVIGVCELIYVYIGTRLYQEFGWKIYKKIGADTDKRTMYRWYQIILTILKIDLFFFLGYSIQYLVLVLKPNDYEFALTIVALPLTCLFLILAVYAIRYESKWLMYFFFLGIIAATAYFIFKICRIYTPSQESKFRYVKAFLTFFATVSLVLVLLTFGNAIICYRNFNKGLKADLIKSDKERANIAHNPIERELSLD